jgi:hypothetical protein
VDDKLIDLLGLKKTDAYRRVEHEHEVRRIQAQRKWHEEADRRRAVNIRQQEEVEQREPDLSTIVPDDSVTAVVRLQQMKRRYDLERIAAVDECSPISSPSPSQYLPRHGRIMTKVQPIPQRQSDKGHAIGHPSVVPTPAVVEPTIIKRKHSLQTIISKAGKLTRLILAAPSDPKYKTYSQRHPPVNNGEKKVSGMGADATGWPRNGKASSSVTHEVFMSTQAPEPRMIFSRNRPQTSSDDKKRSDNSVWAYPRGRRVKKAEKAESKGQRGKWGKGWNKETSVKDTKVMGFASRDIRGDNTPGIPLPNTITQAPRSKYTFTPSNAAGTPQTRLAYRTMMAIATSVAMTGKSFPLILHSDTHITGNSTHTMTSKTPMLRR